MTPILGLSEIAEGVASQAALHNTALREFEGRTTRVLSRATTAPPGSPSEGHSYIIPSGATGVWSGKTNQIATWIGGAWVYYTSAEGSCTPWVNDENVLVTWDGSAWVISGGSTAPFADSTALVQGSADATKKIRFEVDGLTTATTRVITAPDKDGTLAMTNDSHPYDLAGAYVGQPAASVVMMRFKFPRTVLFAAGLAPSQGVAVTAATAQTDFDIQKNASSVGTMRFAAAGTSATFIMASATTFNAGDILTVVAPATPDATLADIAYTLSGTR